MLPMQGAANLLAAQEELAFSQSAIQTLAANQDSLMSGIAAGCDLDRLAQALRVAALMSQGEVWELGPAVIESALAVPWATLAHEAQAPYLAMAQIAVDVIVGGLLAPRAVEAAAPVEVGAA